MKIDRLQLRIIIGFIFVIIMSILVFVFENRGENNFIVENSNKNETVYLNEDKTANITKEDIFLLIDKGLQSSSNGEFFIYSKEFFEDDDMARVFYQGKYKDIVNFIDLDKYRENKFEFVSLRNTKKYIWGYFFERDSEINGTTYIVIDKLSGKLKSINSNLIQVIVY